MTYNLLICNTTSEKPDEYTVEQLFTLSKCFIMKKIKQVKSKPTTILLLVFVTVVMTLWFKDSVSKITSQPMIKQDVLGQASQYVSVVFQSDSAGLLLYPNPASGTLRIVVPFHVATYKWLGIYNDKGQLVKQHTDLSGRILEINVRELPSALYIIRIVDTKGHIWSSRWVKV